MTNSLSVVDDNTLRNKIYEVRGQKVMLDFELAEIYGYETKRFNEQVKNNAEKFVGEDFMFRLTKEEFEKISQYIIVNLRPKKSTSSGQRTAISGWGGRRTLPYAFTEQGIYMLMTVLKGELATKQSRALVRMFKRMKDYIIENQNLIGDRELFKISMQVTDSIQAVHEMSKKWAELDDKMKTVFEKLTRTVERSEISEFLLEMGKPAEKRTYLISNGQPAKARETYINIYAKAEKSIIIVDNYINIKTLRNLQEAKPGVKITVVSDNLGNLLSAGDYRDFRREFPWLKIDFRRTCSKVHDRYIVLDIQTEQESFYLCGSSSKDSGERLTTIAELSDRLTIKTLDTVIQGLIRNPRLQLL